MLEDYKAKERRREEMKRKRDGMDRQDCTVSPTPILHRFTMGSIRYSGVDGGAFMKVRYVDGRGVSDWNTT